jgi:pimeloyl-ACP methyl ester carboxylesterase/DNA-binding CsgD family transcriptional regulator
MEMPPVRYVTTSDGFRIAYTVAGAGRPVVFMPPAIHHVQLSWSPESITHPLVSALASRYCLVQFDGRGQGLSTRDVPESTSMADLLEDLTTVLERVQPGPAVFIGHGATSHVAVNYAAAYPERVAALIFVSCSLANTAWPEALWKGLAATDWDNFLLSTRGVSGVRSDSRALLERMKQIVTQRDWLTRERAYRGSDVSALLEQLAIPALVVHPRAYWGLSPEESINLAASIQGAQFVQIDGDTPYGDTGQLIAAIERFIAALPYAAGEGARPHAGDLPARLSVREQEVLRLIAAGRSNQQIADELVLSLRTVERHITNLYAKIGAHGKADATAYELRHGFER